MEKKWFDMIWYAMVWYEMIWYGMVWYEMVWSGLSWSGLVWSDMIWYDVMWCDVMWCDVMWCDVIWYDMIWHDMTWCDMICSGMTWYDVIWYDTQGPDKASSKTSFSTSPNGADCSRGKTFRETQLAFPQIPHVSGSFPAVYPFSTTESRQDQQQPDFPHLMIGQQAKSSVRCASSQHTLSPSEQGSSHSSGSPRLGRNEALSLCDTYRCVHHTFVRVKSLRLLPSQPWRCDCAETYRLPSHCSPNWEGEKHKYWIDQCVQSHLQASGDTNWENQTIWLWVPWMSWLTDEVLG